MLQTFFNCIHDDIMKRIKTKPPNLFNQRPYLRLLVFVLYGLSEITFLSNRTYPLILQRFAKFLYEMRPQICPQFIFAWIQLLSHPKFMPQILNSLNQKTSSFFRNRQDDNYDELKRTIIIIMIIIVKTKK